MNNFADIAEQLNRLTKSKEKFVWSEECEGSFQTSIEALVKPLVLAFPNLKRTFRITTDASAFGLGAVLGQKMTMVMKFLCLFLVLLLLFLNTVLAFCVRQLSRLLLLLFIWRQTVRDIRVLFGLNCPDTLYFRPAF